MKISHILSLMVLSAFMLTGCAAFQPGQNPQMTVVVGCNVYAATLQDLALYRAKGRLTPGQVKVVDDVRTVINPICTSPTIPSDVTIAAKLTDGVIQLVTVQRQTASQ